MKRKKLFINLIFKLLNFRLLNFALLIFSFLLLSSCKNKTLSTSYYQKALREYSVCNYTQAKTLIESSVKFNSNDEKALFLKAKIYFFCNEYQEAKKIFKSLIYKNKSNIDYKFWLCRTFYFLENINELKELLNKMQEENIEDWRIYYWKALCNKKENNFEQYFYNLSVAEVCIKNSQKVYKELSFVFDELGLKEKSSFYINKVNVLESVYLQSQEN